MSGIPSASCNSPNRCSQSDRNRSWVPPAGPLTEGHAPTSCRRAQAAMLAAELALHKKRGGALGAPAPDAGVGPTFAQPLSIDQLHSVGYGGGELRAMSLPAHNHFISMTGIPPKPRVRPSPAPSLNLADLPILELPEPSVGDSGSLSSSLAAATLLEVEDETVESAHVEESGGTCVAPRASPTHNNSRPAAPPADRRARAQHETSRASSGRAGPLAPSVAPPSVPPVLFSLADRSPRCPLLHLLLRLPPPPPLAPGRSSSHPHHADPCRLWQPPPRLLACCGGPTPEGESIPAPHSHPWRAQHTPGTVTAALVKTSPAPALLHPGPALTPFPLHHHPGPDATQWAGGPLRAPSSRPCSSSETPARTVLRPRARLVTLHDYFSGQLCSGGSRGGSRVGGPLVGPSAPSTTVYTDVAPPPRPARPAGRDPASRFGLASPQFAQSGVATLAWP
jgi:hypothetical protein